MKVPLKPPAIQDTMEKWGEQSKEKLIAALTSNLGPYDSKGRYIHWDKLRHLTPPKDLDIEGYWLALRSSRKNISKSLPFLDKQGCPFSFCVPDGVMRDLFWISENATGAIEADPEISDPSTKKTHLINSLIEEAISSSQLEGAATTRRVAKEMIRTGREPKDHSEKMIINNHNAMRFLRELKNDALTPSMVFELHKILTEGTLSVEDRSEAGRFRDSTDDICVFAKDGTLLHVPPRVEELTDRLQRICDFANHASKGEPTYIHPIIRATIVHFMIGYDHPFIDGNGRTARALFYWVMANEGYWLMEYISISRVIKKALRQYQYAYLYTETDDNDVTYFIIHQLEVIKQAIEDLHHYLSSRSAQIKEAGKLLERSPLQGELNHRQLSLLKNALKNPGAEYTIKSHQTSHGVTYQTARTDLQKLSDEFHLLRRYKIGKRDVFVAPPDLKDLIKNQSC